MQQRHILCHWPRFDKKSLVSVAKKRFENVCAWTKEGRKGRETRRKGSRRSAAERSGGGPTSRDSLQKRARIMNILKSPQGAICWLSFQTFFQPVYIGNNVNLRGAFFILFVSCLRSHASFSRDHLFPSFLFHFPFLFSAAHTISLLASAVCEPINQCEIFALARLTEGPPCHLWALKRVANIANKK